MVSWVSKHPAYILLEVDPRKLLAMLYHGFNVDQKKIPSLIDRLEQGGEVDAPMVTLDKKGLSVVEGEGIHRIVLSIILGLPAIKIAVPADEVTDIEKLIFYS